MAGVGAAFGEGGPEGASRVLSGDCHGNDCFGHRVTSDEARVLDIGAKGRSFGVSELVDFSLVGQTEKLAGCLSFGLTWEEAAPSSGAPT